MFRNANCNCQGSGGFWCWLDGLLGCHLHTVCDAHDRHIMKGTP